MILPGFDYFTKVFDGELKPVLDLYEVAQYLRPSKIFEHNPAANDLDSWVIVKAISNGNISLDSLKGELAAYKALATGVDPNISNNVEKLSIFWENNQQRLPTFTALFLHFCILNPSSASVERVFSFLKHYMDETAYNSLEDYTLLKVMKLFNQES